MAKKLLRGKPGLLEQSAKESLSKVDMLAMKAGKGIRSVLEKEPVLDLKDTLKRRR